MTEISKNAEKLLQKRYYLRDKNGNLLEHSWNDIAKRVGYNVGSAEKEELRKQWQETYTNKIANMDFIPSSPCLFNADTQSQQLSSCFVLDIEDNIEGIFHTVAECAKIFQMSGGAGFSMRKIRPKGAICKSSGSVASGVVSFMHVFDEVVNRVKQGNKRNGALKIDLPIDHPEIFEFIHCKDNTNELNNMNISVSITKEFIDAVENDLDWDLKFNGTIYKTVKAKDLWNEIMLAAWKTGEPGLSFQTNMDAGNMNPHLSANVYGNPCFTGDMKLLTQDGYKAFKELENKEVQLINADGNISIGKVWCNGIKKIILLALSNGKIITCTPNHIFMLSDNKQCKAKNLVGKELKTYNNEKIMVEDIIDEYEAKVYDFSEPLTHWGVVENCIVHNCHEYVNIPYSSCNLASVLLNKCIKDGKLDKQLLKENVQTTVRFIDDMISVNHLPLPKIQEITEKIRPIGMGTMGLANLLYELKIPYNSEEGQQFINNLYSYIKQCALEENCKLAEEKGIYPAWKGSKWDTEKHLKVRCSSMLSIAPNGSIAFIANTTGGCEPEFALVYQRMDNEKDTYYVVNPVFERYLRENNLYNDDILNTIIKNKGSIQGLDNLFSKDIQRIFVTAGDISPEWHVKILATIQKYIDLSISKTVNLPNTATVEDVSKVYLMAGKMGVKGVTVYRDGCRQDQVLSTNINKAKPTKKPEMQLEWGTTIESSDDLIGRKRKVITGCGSLHVNAYFDPVDGKLMEVYLSKGSSGGCNSYMIGLSRFISAALRTGMSFAYAIDQLQSIPECASYAVRTATKHDTNKGKCCPNAISYALIDMQNEIFDELGIEEAKFINNKPKIVSKTDVNICPECGEKLRFEGGCNTCPNCGYSKCS